MGPLASDLRVGRTPRMRAIRVLLRVSLGVGGGYAASAACSAALALILERAMGFERGESTVLCAMLGFAFYLFALLWALTTAKLGRAAVVFGGGVLLGYGVVQWLSPVMVSAVLLPLPIGG